MSAKHTEGPWTLTHVHGSNFAVQAFEIRGMFGVSANTYPIFNKDLDAIDGDLIYVSPADARLIAAAPELKDELWALAVAYESDYKDLTGNDTVPPAIVRARALLARIDGEAQEGGQS